MERGAALYQALVDEGRAGEAELWNLGICATGAGLGQVAVRAWTSLGFKATIGDDGLPFVDKIGMVKVRLSSGTLTERPPARHYEHVWVQPRSPCHGEVLNPTMYDAADIGDLVLWDGQAIGRWRVNGREGHRFAALARLARGNQRSFRFRARRPTPAALQAVSDELPESVDLYTFADSVAWECATCIRTGGPHNESHQSEGPPPPAQVSGKLVVRDGAALSRVRAALEKALHAHGVTLATPTFYTAIGDELGARRHAALWDSLGTGPDELP